ncbi:MAG TPA: hypothetical protein VEA16_13640, partial [Vicinamibacterales bacterium]|nr:hypothetical protein [Vicinamibacterales bacterium]
MAGLWSTGEQVFEPRPLCAVPRHGRAQADCLQPHPEFPDVLVQHGSDGPDYTRVCQRHQWASVPMPDRAPACPLCIAEVDEQRGRLRYA